MPETRPKAPRACIDPYNADEMARWAKHFGVSVEALLNAIISVGDDVQLVAQHLGKPWPVGFGGIVTAMIATIRTALSLTAILGPMSAAFAQGRPSTTDLTCAQAAGLVQSRGVVVLGTGGQTYDRFVSDRGRCDPSQYVRSAIRPTRDNPSCMIGYTCYDPGGTRGGG